MSSTSTSARPFVAPGRVVAGPGAVGALGDELGALGIAPRDGTVVVVADAAILHLGHAARAVSALDGAGFAIDVRPPVTGEPTSELMATLALDDPERPVAAVVAIGGGSAIDAGKLVALAHPTRWT
jgi:alcohol dehydrogenase class IV